MLRRTAEATSARVMRSEAPLMCVCDANKEKTTKATKAPSMRAWFMVVDARPLVDARPRLGRHKLAAGARSGCFPRVEC